MSIKDDILLVKKLMFFVEVTKNGKLKNTAFSNGIKQSNLSKAISELEAEIGLKLFNRLQNGLSLTKEGQDIFEIACAINHTVHKLHTFKNTQQATAGEIRLWIGDGVASGYISKCLADFYADYPKISLDIKCSIESPQMIQEADIALVYERPTQNDAIIVSEQNLEFGLFASAEYLSRCGYPKDMNDLLENHRICTRDNYSTVWKKWANFIDKAQNVSVTTNSSSVLMRLTKDSVGIALHPMSIAAEEKDLIHLSKIKFSVSHPYWIVSHRNTKDIPKVRALINYLQKMSQ